MVCDIKSNHCGWSWTAMKRIKKEERKKFHEWSFCWWMVDKMKLPNENIINNKSELCISTIKCNECCDLKTKFSIRNINFLFCALYMIIFITSYYMTNYVHYVIEQKSNEFRSNCEKIIDREIVRNRITLHRNSINGWVIYFFFPSKIALL